MATRGGSFFRYRVGGKIADSISRSDPACAITTLQGLPAELSSTLMSGDTRDEPCATNEPCRQVECIRGKHRYGTCTRLRRIEQNPRTFVSGHTRRSSNAGATRWGSTVDKVRRTRFRTAGFDASRLPARNAMAIRIATESAYDLLYFGAEASHGLLLQSSRQASFISIYINKHSSPGFSGINKHIGPRDIDMLIFNVSWYNNTY